MIDLIRAAFLVLLAGLAPLFIELLLHWRLPQAISRLAYRPMRAFDLVGRPMRTTQEGDGYRDNKKASFWPGGPLAGPATLRGDDGVVIWVDANGTGATVQGPGRLNRKGPLPSTLRLSIRPESNGALGVSAKRLPAPLSTYFLLPAGILPLAMTNWAGTLDEPTLGPLFWVALLLLALGVGGHIWRQLAELQARLAAEHVLAESERVLGRYLSQVAEREAELAA